MSVDAKKYVTAACLEDALVRLHGQADHLLKIWLTLKHMGLAVGGAAIEIDTGNSQPSLDRLFGFGHPDGDFFVPFAHTARYSTMKHDAARSIIQTTVQRWASSGSVVTCNPEDYLDFSAQDDGKVAVICGRAYPLGLGHGKHGFARDEDARVALPITSLAVWYGRQTPIPPDEDAEKFLTELLVSDLGLSEVERSLVLADDDLGVETASKPISDEDLHELCTGLVEDGLPNPVVLDEDYSDYNRKVRAMVPDLEKPVWLRSDPEGDLTALLDAGMTAVLLYGPPRTGKTRSIDEWIPRNSAERETIQIHDGWTYDQLVQGLFPDAEGNWAWRAGALMEALAAGKQFIVLEEINRTEFTQALGEVFSLIEPAYRGDENAVKLRDGTDFSIDSQVIIVMTMNTVDKSTEEVDDALLGRIAAVEFPPDPQALRSMLEANKVPGETRDRVAELFAAIQDLYPLGHGYFVDLSGDVDAVAIQTIYKARVRPVLKNHLGDLGASDLLSIDNLVDTLFS